MYDKQIECNLIAIDGSFLGFRSLSKFFADAGYESDNGFVHTGTIFSFLSDLVALSKTFKSAKWCVCWDCDPTNRKAIFLNYKAGRKENRQKDDVYYQQYLRMKEQLNEIKKLLPLIGVIQYYSIGNEADDVLASLVKYRRNDTDRIAIVARDKDLYQLLNPGVILYDFSSAKDADWFRKEFNLESSQWVDVQTLVGDSVDNIPGIRGVGIKTAIKLLNKYRTIEEALVGIKNCNRTLEEVMFTKKLVELNKSVKLSLVMPDVDLLKFRDYLAQKQMNSMLGDSKAIDSIAAFI